MTATATPKEIMATVIANDLRDGEWVEVGANLPVPRAGALLAHLTHGPNMTVMLAMTKAYLHDVPVIEEFAFITDVAATRWAEAYYPHDRLLSEMRFWRRGVFFAGGIQLDRFGNSNLIGLGSDRRRLALRGPGAIATTTNASHVRRFYLFVNEHSPRVFVPRCDFVSTVGWAEGGADARRRLGLPGGGPRYCVTPLAVMDFEESSKRMRLHSVHPGVTVDEVRARTGFDLLVPAHVPVTPAPGADELDILRTRVDPQGLLRR